MNTHDKFELPPNPITPMLAVLIDKASGEGTADAVWQLMQEYARAAVEAERKRQQETVVALEKEIDSLAFNSSGLIAEVRKLKAELRRRGEPVAGYTMVPVEPTPQMIAAFRSGFQNELHKNDRRRTMSAEEAGLRAMLKAAPQPAESSGASNLHKDSCGAQNENQAPQPAEPVKTDSAGYTLGPISDGGMDPRQPCPQCTPVDGKQGPAVQSAWHAGWEAGRAATQAGLPQEKPDPHYEEGTSDVIDHALHQTYVDGWNAYRKEALKEPGV